jgi:hypothetical protein
MLFSRVKASSTFAKKRGGGGVGDTDNGARL